MSFQPVTTVRIALLLAAATAAGCGGSYGGGGGNEPPATLTLSVTPTTITLGESATLTWTSNAPNCTASGAWSGAKAGDGSETVTPAVTGTLTYSLRCSGGRYSESDEDSATLTVDPTQSAAAFVALACCDSGRTFAVEGIRNAAGDIRLLAPGRHWIGKAGKPAARFAAGDSSLAGARLAGMPPFELRRVVRRAGAARDAAIEGVYTTHLASGFTLTLGIDAAGRMSGIDTRGCRLDGRALARTPGSPVFGVALEVSGCGEHDGRYAGDAALLAGDAGETKGLLLSVSNAKAAIGWRLDR